MARRFIASACAVAIVVAPAAAWANGFFLYETSPKTVAEGGAAVADGAEPSTVLYNPAGMTRLPGFQAQFSVYTYFASNSYENLTTGQRTDAQTGIFPIPAEYATYKPLNWLALGVGGYSIFGLTLVWPDNWEGYQIVKKASLRSYSVQPSVAVGPFQGVSLAACFDILQGSVELSRGLPLGSGQWGTTVIGGSGVGYGANFGLLYEPSKWVRGGITYRTPVKVSLDPGQASFDVPAAFDQQLKGQDVRTSITLPGIAIFGARVTPTKDLEVEVDAGLLMWHSYDKLALSFEDPSLNQSVPKNWHNAWEFRIGAQYKIDDLALRLGFLFDQTPQPDATVDPTLPDNYRVIPSVGLGYQFTEWLRGDLGYHFVYVLPRTVDASVNSFPGTYRAQVHTLVAGLAIAL